MPDSQPSHIDVIDCLVDRHLEPILGIVNEAIENSTALYEYRPRSSDSMRDWFGAKTAAGLPVLGAVDARGELIGFATFGAFRPYPAYEHTVEHSVYVHRDHRGRGVGTILLRRLIAAATGRGLHVMVGAIDAANEASIALHRRLGFMPCGIVRQAGFKFGRWLDLALYQLILETPAPAADRSSFGSGK